MSTTVNAIPEGLTTAEIRTMGIETSLLAVQANRAEILEKLLTDQMVALQEKNGLIARYNTLMASLNGILSAFPKDAGPTAGIPQGTNIENYAEALKALGMTQDQLMGAGTVPNKTALESAVTNVKSTIDNLSNTQQMDMLRIQSISNKRNEAFEMMTTFIKKFGDMISAIIRNMA